MGSSTVSLLDTVLKATQLGFYLVGATVAILTYRSAKRGLLNSVNTEYQKRVMDRMQALSEELYSEFDENSESYWANQKVVEEAIKHINATFIKYRSSCVKAGEYSGGLPHNKELQRLMRLQTSLISDPFLPREIRTIIINFLTYRINLHHTVIFQELRAYGNDLAQLKHDLFEPDSTSAGGLHNRVNQRLREHGCGVEDVLTAVRQIREEMQRYYEGFDPNKRYVWLRKSKRIELPSPLLLPSAPSKPVS